MRNTVLLILLQTASLVVGQSTTAPTTLRSESATVPTPRDPVWLKRHQSLVERAGNGNVDLYLLGDSITDAWERKFRENFDKHFADLHAADFGISGDRTEHVLYRITNGELYGVHPKVIMLLIGTNNLVEQYHLTPDTPEETAAGVKNILAVIREKQPQAKVLLLAVFPRGDKPGAMAKVDALNAIISKYDDGHSIYYANINHQLVGDDGSVHKDLFPDLLHPNEKGYDLWAKAVMPKLRELLSISDGH